MTRRASIIALLVVAGLVVLGLQSWSVAIERVERHVIAGIEQRFALRVTGLQRAEIAFLPMPRISLSQVAFTRLDGAVSGTAARLRVRARLLPLLAGTLSFDRIDLVSPVIDVAIDAAREGAPNWLATPLTYLGGVASQGRIVMVAGSVFMRRGGAIATTLRDIDMVIDERTADEPIAMSGTLTWRGVATRLSLLWPVTGERAPLSLTLNSALVSARLDGVRSGATDPVVNGKLNVSARSAPEMLDWFGDPPRLAAALGAFTLAADAQIRPREISLSKLVLMLDDDRLDGALKLGEPGSRWALSGTLAGSSLDLGRLYARLDLPWERPAPDGATPLQFEDWTAHDLDLRVSVEAARAGGARISDVATYLLVQKGRFEAGVLRASAYGGAAKGRLLAVAAPAGVDVRLQAGLDRINLAQAGAHLPQLERATGTASLNLALEGAGRTAEEIVGALSGKFGVALRQGEIGGLALLDILRRGERSPAAAARDWRQGRTPFESATLNATVSGGVATIAEAQMQGPAYRLALSGEASLPRRWVALRGRLSPANDAVTIPLALSGPFGALTLAPDLGAIQRGKTPLTR